MQEAKNSLAAMEDTIYELTYGWESRPDAEEILKGLALRGYYVMHKGAAEAAAKYWKAWGYK